VQFWITVRHDRRNYRYLVEYIQVSKAEERFKVIARNGSILFTSNRPLFRNKGIKRRKPDLTVIEGHLKSQSMEQVIIDQLQLFIEKNLEK
jgi:hypothetical protein